MAKREKNEYLHEELKEMGYHIPENVKWFTIDAPSDSVVTVTCSYILYKEDQLNIDWGKVEKDIKYEIERSKDFTREEIFLEGIRYALREISNKH